MEVISSIFEALFYVLNYKLDILGYNITFLNIFIYLVLCSIGVFILKIFFD